MANAMTLTGTRFGQIEYSEQDVVRFEDGLIGFPDLKHFVLICTKANSPFRWLQSLEQPDLAFLVADPEHFVADYAPVISMNQAISLGLDEETPRLLLTTATIPAGKPELMTLNLAGPLIINAQTRCGKQVVLEDEAYTIKHRVFQEANRVSENIAA